MTQRSKNKSNFKKGSVEMLLLHLLKTEGDCYGYQLSQLINQRSSGVLVIPEGSMYIVVQLSRQKSKLFIMN